MVGLFLAALTMSSAIIAGLLWTRVATRIATDVPNTRSLHDTPTPRVGGWGIVPTVLAITFWAGAADALLSALALLLFVVSYADDRWSLPVLARLVVHAAAAVLWLALGPVSLPVAVAVLATLGIIWTTNLFNFMDGADGLAGGMAVFAFTIYGAVAATAGMMSLASWAFALAGAAAGFLFFNLHPARIFLGDAGSVTLGFFAGAFGIWGWAANAWPLWFPFLVSAPFFVDATATVLRRMLRGEAFWRAHREHYYQRLIRSGWSHGRVAVCEYVAMALSAALALWMLHWSPTGQWVGVVVALTAYAALASLIDRRWSRFQSELNEDVAADRDSNMRGHAITGGSSFDRSTSKVRGHRSE